MRTSAFVCSISDLNERADGALKLLVFHLDARQWTQAGIELGRIERIGEHVADLARLARDAMHEDEFVARAAGEGGG